MNEIWPTYRDMDFAGELLYLAIQIKHQHDKYVNERSPELGQATEAIHIKLNMIMHSLYLKAKLIYLKSKKPVYKKASVEHAIIRSIYGELQVLFSLLGRSSRSLSAVVFLQ